MDVAVFFLLALNFLFLVSLPFVFFEKRDGRLNPMWWATAAPFVVCPGLVVASELGLMPLFVSPDGGLGRGLTLFGVLLSASSIALVAFTLGNHQAPLSQWHQENDAPRELVTHGAYSRIRHPFYAAYLLAFLAAVSICPTAGTPSADPRITSKLSLFSAVTSTRNSAPLGSTSPSRIAITRSPLSASFCSARTRLRYASGYSV